MKAGDAFRDPATFSRERARPLAPEDRRSAIVEAVLPLVAERGRDVSTRELAETAGVAEGTIFRAFGDKESLIDAVVVKLLDPSPLRAALRRIAHDLPLERKLAEILRQLRDHFRGVFGVVTALGLKERPGPPARDVEEWRRVLAELLAPHATELAVPVETAGDYLRLVAFSTSIPPLSGSTALGEDEIARLVIHGVASGGARKD